MNKEVKEVKEVKSKSSFKKIMLSTAVTTRPVEMIINVDNILYLQKENGIIIITFSNGQQLFYRDKVEDII